MTAIASSILIIVVIVVAGSFAAVIPRVFPADVSTDGAVLDCDITPFAIIVSVTGLGIVTFALFEIAGTTVVNEFMVTVLKVALGIGTLAGVMLTSIVLAAASESVLASAAIVVVVPGIFVGTSVFGGEVEGTWTSVLIGTVAPASAAAVVVVVPALVDIGTTFSLETAEPVPESPAAVGEVAAPLTATTVVVGIVWLSVFVIGVIVFGESATVSVPVVVEVWTLSPEAIVVGEFAGCDTF